MDAERLEDGGRFGGSSPRANLAGEGRRAGGVSSPSRRFAGGSGGSSRRANTGEVTA
jgi:hypothetical protein